MTIERIKELLRIAIDHIENFEEDEAENVFKSLGFSEDELVEIKTKVEFDKDDARTIAMVEDKIFYKGKLIWKLSAAGAEYIFSDQEEDTSAAQGFVSDCVPFKNHPYYVEVKECSDGTLQYIGYVWYDRYNNFIEQFNDLGACFDWLVDR